MISPRLNFVAARQKIDVTGLVRSKVMPTLLIKRGKPFALAAATAFTLGCGDNTIRTPFLDQDVLWTLEGNPCFGNGGTAVGDLDGDGIDDLVVPTPNCRLISVPGAVEPQIAVYRGTPSGFDSRPVVHLYTDIAS